MSGIYHAVEAANVNASNNDDGEDCCNAVHRREVEERNDEVEEESSEVLCESVSVPFLLLGQDSNERRGDCRPTVHRA